MAYDTFNLTGTYQFFDGTAKAGNIVIIPSVKQVKDTEGNVLLSGRLTIPLVEDVGNFLVSLPDPNDATLNPSGFGYTVVAKLRDVHLPAVSFGPDQVTGPTLDVEDITPVDVSTLIPTVQYPTSVELAAEVALRVAGDTTLDGRLDTIEAIGAASTSAQGYVELATTGEAVTGTDTVRAVTPAGILAAFQAFVAGAPGALDTWLEIVAQVQADQSGLGAMTTLVNEIRALTDPTIAAALTNAFAALDAAPVPVTSLTTSLGAEIIPGAVSIAVATAHTVAINAWIDANKSTSGGAKLYFPPGEWHVYGEVGVTNPTDLDARIHLEGQGRRATRIYQDNAAANCLRVAATTSGNLRGVVVKDLSLYQGIRAIELDDANYCLFENVSFMQQTEYCVKQSSSYSNHFVNCWWVHQSGDAFLSNGAGTTFFHGCQIGEESGAIILNGGLTVFDGCNFVGGVVDQLVPAGISGMGPAAFSVTGYAALYVNASNIDLTHGLVNVDQCRSVKFSNCRIYAADATLLNVRRSLDFAPIALQGCTVVVPAAIAAYASAISSDHYNIRIQNNDFRIGASGDLTFDDRLLKPELGAQLDGNTYLRGAVNL